MAVEIERKFLVIGEQWRSSEPGNSLFQGYLCIDPGCSVRIRLSGDRAFLTVKGNTRGISRLEFEYPVPPDDARQLLKLCKAAVIEKTRYKVEFRGHAWDIDEFHGLNKGLILAEVELESEDAVVDLPPWVGKEVTGDKRYFNLYLAQHPYSCW